MGAVSPNTPYATTGCRVTTTTISQEQFDYAKRRFASEGIDDRVSLLRSDYRDLEGRFDKLVSIEMIEAVGHEYFDTFFRKCSDLLKPDGLFALQAITIPDQRYDRYRRSVDFIQKYIFPGGFLPSLGAINGSVGRVTDLQVVHLEDFAEHYARTLRHWRERFHENARSNPRPGNERTVSSTMGILSVLLRRRISGKADWCVSVGVAEAGQPTCGRSCRHWFSKLFDPDKTAVVCMREAEVD